MARYTGPRLRKMRALGCDLPGLSQKSMERRPYPPGQHGQRRRGRVSDFGRQLVEKQKLRYNYGIGERQFRLLMREAKRSKMATGDKLLELLERRLDNVVFRAGFAPTIPAARQLTRHGHLLVNGKRVNIPSFRVKEGDTIGLREKSKNLSAVKESFERPALTRPAWIGVDGDKQAARIESLPDVSSVPFECEVQLVVEYYSKRM